MTQIDMMSKSMALMQEHMKELLNGQDPVQLFIQSVNNVMDKLNNELVSVTQMKELATSTEERGKMIKEETTSDITKVDSISMPALTPKPPPADASILDEAAEFMRQQVANRVIAQIREAVDGIKTTLKSPLVEIKDNATELAEFSKVLQDISDQGDPHSQRADHEVPGSSVQAKTFPDLFNVAMKTVTEAMGIQDGIDMNDILAKWHEIGPMLDTADKLVGALASAPEEGEGGAGPSMAPAEPPPEQ